MSERDKEYMRRLGEYEADAHAERLADHLRASLAERLRRSVALAQRFRATANLAGRIDDPMPFYDHARRVGLYRP